MSQPPGPPPPPPVPSGPGGDSGDVSAPDPPFATPAGQHGDGFHVPFSVLDAFVAAFIWFLGQLAVGVVFTVVLLVGDTELTAAWLLVMATVGSVVGLSVALVYLNARGRLTWRLWGPRRPDGRVVLLGLGIGVLATFATYVINAALVLIFEPEDPVEQQVLDFVFEGGLAMALAILYAVVLAPVAEELLFRGLLFQALRRRIGLWAAAVMSALVFTAIHGEIITSQPLALVGLFFLGVVLAWAFHRTGSLLVPMIMHALFNAFALGLATLGERLDPPTALVLLALVTPG